MFPNKLEKVHIKSYKEGVKYQDYVEIKVKSPNGNHLIEIITIQTKDIPQLIKILETCI